MCCLNFQIFCGLVPGFVSLVVGFVSWVSGFVFSLSGIVSCVSELVFWVSGMPFGCTQALLVEALQASMRRVQGLRLESGRLQGQQFKIEGRYRIGR